MRTLLSSSLLATLFLSPTRAPSQEGVELRWRGKPGEVLRLRFDMLQSMASSMLPEAVESRTSFVTRQEVKQVSADGIGSLDVAYEGIRIKAGGPATMDYDSTRKDGQGNDPTLVAILEPMLAADMHMKITPTGHILELGGFEQAFAGMKAKVPQMGEAFEQMLGGDSLKRMLEVNVFPEKKLVAGDSWKREVELEAPMLGTMTMQIDNVFQGTEERGGTECARIEISGTIELGQSSGPFQVRLEDGTISGTMFLALSNGFLQESNLDTKMSLSIDASGTETTMDMDMKQHTVRIGEKDPLFE
jgi:hypothetical protein